MVDLLLGADVGGSSTRVAVATVDEGVVAVARSGPGNPNLVGLDGSAAVIRATAARALAGVHGTVALAVVGLAGGSRASAEPGFLPAALPEQVGGRAVLVSDLAVSFSSATPATTGCILIAGTGAVAARLVEDELQDRHDGWGWLLGDRGSGFWLGRAAVRATLATLDAGRAPERLAADVLREAGASDHLSLLQACYDHPPTWLAGFAPLVSRWAEEDEDAASIADRAAELLAQTLSEVGPRPGEPLVLGGSVLATPGPVRTRLVARLPPGLPVLAAESGVVGATWIAARRTGVATTALHERLLDTAAGAPQR